MAPKKIKSDAADGYFLWLIKPFVINYTFDDPIASVILRNQLQLP